MLGQDPKLERVYGLTKSQMSIWTGQRLNPESPLYNMVYTFDLEGEIDTNHFRKAFKVLVEKCEALRTVFDETKDYPRQIILENLDFEMEVLDWSSESFTEEHLEEWLDERIGKLFDLSKRTFESILIKLSEKRSIWYFNQHHLTTDARASLIIFTKMSELYSKSVEGNLGEVSAFHKFENYLIYEQTVRKEPEHLAIDEYWAKKLASVEALPKLYEQNGEKATTESKRVVVDLGEERTVNLQELAKEKDLRAFTEDLSHFNIFATVLLAYLYRISGQNKLVFGSPVQNRTTPEFKNTPGLFIEFFPFVHEVKNDDTFASLFKRVSGETFEFLRNARPAASSTKSNRAFNVVLNYINTGFPDFAGIPCKATWMHPNNSDANHHMRLHVYKDARAKSIQLFFDLNTTIFDEQNLETVSNHFLKLLDAFIENRIQQVNEASLLGDSEFNRLVKDFNDAEDFETETVVDMFRKQAEQTPNAIAIVDKKQSFSFAELDKISDRLANYLLETSVKNGDRVALYLNRSADFIISMLASLKAGCAYIPIAVNSPERRLAEKVKISQSSIIITGEKFEKDLREISTRIFTLDKVWDVLKQVDTSELERNIDPESLAYIIFTSGSTGIPKGVRVSHIGLGNYVRSACDKYSPDIAPTFPLFTAIDFDLTVTSMFVPLVSGGSIRVYEEEEAGPDLAILDVMDENEVNAIKLTPSHLTLIRDRDLSNSKIKTMIVGGEDLKTELARKIEESFPDNLVIYNEYGPTEATVGCIVHRFNSANTVSSSVPIGKPFARTMVYILDGALNPVPEGVTGRLFLSGISLSDGYWKNADLTRQKFVSNPFAAGAKMYDTGDFARLNSKGAIEYLGREDEQVKIGGIRVELGEIETALANYPGIENCVVELIKGKSRVFREEILNCVRCGLPSNYPAARFNENGICRLCDSFGNYQKKAQKYFKTPDDLKKVFEESNQIRKGEYDCLMLLSGGKDSTYALAKLVGMGAEVLAFTLDNGYISNGAKANISRVVKELDVDHVFGKTPAMNEIFVDSLVRHKNVCNGCFKTIYTLSMKVALEKDIPFIVTGLSRGQFFETRLTEELFWNDDVEAIDQTILEARKAYHRVDDAVKRNLDSSFLQDQTAFERVRFLDFYRYFDIKLEDMMEYLDDKLPWIRPTDTGRSTNCLINQVGIYVHKKEEGYSNYAFPYSWDVRMGHKTREVSLDEINEEIDETGVKKIMSEIGYVPNNETVDEKLIGYYVALEDISPRKLRNTLAKQLPAYMIPVSYVRLENIPLTDNGKIDRKALRKLTNNEPEIETEYVPPETEFEEVLAEIWSEVLNIDRVGVHEDFLEIGGNSLSAIRIMTRANESFQLDLPLNRIFEMPTIKSLSKSVEKTIIRRLSVESN